jgi:hypothetical protein
MFSLRMLLAVVTLCAVYIAGMLFRTPWWEASILTLTYMIFAGSIAAAILSREHRAFFVTFAAFGLAYCASVYFRMELVTTRALDELVSRVQGKVVIRDDGDGDKLVKFGSGPAALYVNPFAENPQLNGTSVPVTQNADPVDDAPRQSDPSADPYFSSLRLKSIGQAFFAVLFGLVTGVIAEAIVKKNQQPSSSAARASATA